MDENLNKKNKKIFLKTFEKNKFKPYSTINIKFFENLNDNNIDKLTSKIQFKIDFEMNDNDVKFNFKII
jgi:hypothetical protein